MGWGPAPAEVSGCGGFSCCRETGQLDSSAAGGTCHCPGEKRCVDDTHGNCQQTGGNMGTSIHRKECVPSPFLVFQSPTTSFVGRQRSQQLAKQKWGLLSQASQNRCRRLNLGLIGTGLLTDSEG